METKTTVREMLSGNSITVPKYQRAYSWDAEKQVKQFLNDIDDYIASHSATPYYFGHFIFETVNDDNDCYNVIDGQQRLTTIEIFLAAVFKKLKTFGELQKKEKDIKEDVIKRQSKYHFSTVEYDNSFFKDYVIDQKKISKDTIETLSASRIADAFDFFEKQLVHVGCDECKKYIEVVVNAACTTHTVSNESEAIQMFIFQNNRGKHPTKLEIIKAQFMYEIQISSLDEATKYEKIKELQERFEDIYKAIATIENNIDEDTVLLYALRVYFNTFNIDVSTEKIEQELKEKTTALEFIMDFTFELKSSFESLKLFFSAKSIYEIYSFAILGATQMMPFVIKAYEFNIPESDKAELFSALESLVLRHRIIGTRAHLEDRMNEKYSEFTKDNMDIRPIIEHIKMIKNPPERWWWWQYWSNQNFENALQGWLPSNIAKHLLWKYENYLRSKEKKGYKFMPMDQIENPQLEHIAPQTPTDETPIAAGYCIYDEEFKNSYLDCLGNYLLISQSHNCSIGNVPFKDKRNSYTVLLQHREVQEMTKDKIVWNKKKINMRHDKILDFIMKHI